MDEGRRNVNWNHYGLDSDDIPRLHSRTRNQNQGGFVDLGDEYQYGAGGHQPSSQGEIFADVQGDRPWYIKLDLHCL